MATKQEHLRSLPKVDEAMASVSEQVGNDTPLNIVKNSIQYVIELERANILAGESSEIIRTSDQWNKCFVSEISKRMKSNLQRIINGTGVVVHTNLGRSLLTKEASTALNQAGYYYSNLEFNVHTGKRGSRYSLVEDIICELTGAEAALVVNNNAAAVLLVLDTLAHGKEVIVSRGQLVEIGGSFRIPDVMKKSGATLVEVGATNRTHRYDYENAITEDTAILLRVHTSNFRIIGFTSDVSPEELVKLGNENNIPVVEDLGSGSLIDLSSFGLPKEPTVQELVKEGVDVITFSGDKLLGGPQAGIIVGKKAAIDSIKKNQLNRALRIDKFTLASLESVLREYYDMEKALKRIPTLSMLTISNDILKKRGQKLLRRIKAKVNEDCDCELVRTDSRVGGGAMPEYNLNSWAVQLTPKSIKLNQMEREFRQLDIPVVGRIEDEKFLLDMRTIQKHEVLELGDLLISYFNHIQQDHI